MKTLKCLPVLFLFFLPLSGVAQQYDASKMPFVTENLLDQHPLWINIDHRITISGAWGVGMSAFYTKRKVIHATAVAGYGWGWAATSKEVNNPLKTSHFKPYFEVAAGYPVYDFTWGRNGRYVLSRYSSGGDQYEDFYKVKIPVTTMIIPMANFRLNPNTWQFSKSTSGDAVYPPTMKYTAVVPTLGFGIKILTMGRAEFNTNKNGSGETLVAQRQGSIYLGVVRPVLRETVTPGGPYNVLYPTQGVIGNTKLAAEVIFELTPKHNSIGSIFFGARGIGYNNNAQFVFGNTFTLN